MYFAAQMLGGFVGSGIVYANYISAIDLFEGGKMRTVPPAEKATAAIFCTYPQPFLTKTSQFFSEFIASTLLMFVIFALKDPSNNGVPKVGIAAVSRGMMLMMFIERQVVPVMPLLSHLRSRVMLRMADWLRDKHCARL